MPSNTHKPLCTVAVCMLLLQAHIQWCKPSGTLISARKESRWRIKHVYTTLILQENKSELKGHIDTFKVSK